MQLPYDPGPVFSNPLSFNQAITTSILGDPYITLYVFSSLLPFFPNVPTLCPFPANAICYPFFLTWKIVLSLTQCILATVSTLQISLFSKTIPLHPISERSRPPKQQDKIQQDREKALTPRLDKASHQK